MNHDQFVEKIKAVPAYNELLPIHGERLFLKGVNGEYNILAIRLAWQLLGAGKPKHHNVEIHKEYSSGKLIEREVQLRGGWFGINWHEAPADTDAWEATEEGAKWIIKGENFEEDTLIDAPLYGYNKEYEDSYTLKPLHPKRVLHPQFNARYLAGLTAAFRDGTFGKICQVEDHRNISQHKVLIALHFENTVEVHSPTCPAEPQVYECDYQGFFSGVNEKSRDFDILYLME